MRNELLQERASRQDLECDKIALERQVHTLLSGRLQIHTRSQASTHSSHLCLLSFAVRLCPLLRHFLIFALYLRLRDADLNDFLWRPSRRIKT